MSCDESHAIVNDGITETKSTKQIYINLETLNIIRGVIITCCTS